MLIVSRFSLQLTIQKSKKNSTLHLMGKTFISYLTGIKFKIWRVLKKKNISQNLRDERFSGNNGNIKCALIPDELNVDTLLHYTLPCNRNIATALCGQWTSGRERFATPTSVGNIWFKHS